MWSSGYTLHALRAEQKTKEKSCGFRGCVRRATCSVAKPRNGACSCSSAHRGTIRLGTIFALSSFLTLLHAPRLAGPCGLRSPRALISLCNAYLTRISHLNSHFLLLRFRSAALHRDYRCHEHPWQRTSHRSHRTTMSDRGSPSGRQSKER